MKEQSKGSLVTAALIICAAMIYGVLCSAEAAVKEPSGTLTMAVASGAEETFLPWNGGVIRLEYLRGTIYETLVFKNRKAKLVPQLATTWERIC